MNSNSSACVPLPRSFYEEAPEKVARKLLGKMMIRRFEGKLLSGIIVEVEAYLSENDPASHNFKGKTKRNTVLFGEAGHAYVHSMRQYYLIDIVTESIDNPSSVLIRALEPIEGLVEMQITRRTSDPLKLASGPSRLCQALSIDKVLNGQDVTDSESPLIITSADVSKSQRLISVSPRIGISKASDSLLRFYIKDNPHVSLFR